LCRYFRQTKELYDVEESYPEQMDNCQLNPSNPDSFFEYMNVRSSKSVFLQLFQLSMKTTVQESKQLNWSSSDTAFASNTQLLDSVSVQWNSLKENSPESITDDREEAILGSDHAFGPVTETFNVPDYSHNLACFDAKTPSSNHTCSDYRCCCDVLNCSDDLSCSGSIATSNCSDVIDQHNVQSCHFSVRHRNSCLYPIDLCSLVGQRYLKFQNAGFHFNPDDEVSYDLYCHWPMIEDTSRWLRPRPEPYPVTFRKEGDSSSFTHLYKFSRAEQMEFARKVGHWLNRRSRKLHRQMKLCFVPLARLPVISLTKYQSFQPVVRLNRLSQSVIKRWTKRERVVNSRNKVSPKHRRRSGHPVCRATSSVCPIVPLTRCDVKCTKMSLLLEQQRAKRVPLSCLNRSGVTFPERCSSLGVTSHSFGGSNLSENSSLLYKKLIRKPTILLERVSTTFKRIKFPPSVSGSRAWTSSNHRKNQSLCLSMKNTPLNLTAENCMVLLKDVGVKHIKKGNPSSEMIGMKRKVKQMKIDKCFVSLTDCSRQNSLSIASTRRIQIKRRRHSNPEWLCVKENHSAMTKSLASTKSVRPSISGVVLKQNRSNVI